MKCFDIHSDIWTDVTIRHLNGEKNIFEKYHLKRLKDGNNEGSIFVIWVDPPYDIDYNKRTKEIFAAIKEEEKNSKSFRIVHNYNEMMQAKKDGIFYVFLGIEGMAYVGNDLSKINDYYDIGVRHGMLTWNESNTLASGALSGVHSGLTNLGKKAVKFMQDKNMLVDVSHINEAGFWDIISMTEKPIIASHSNASALCPVPRNLTDEQLRAIRDVNGVVGLNAFNFFVSSDPRKQNVQRLSQHAAHIINTIGIDHLACGFDFFEFIENSETIATMTNADSPCTTGIANSSEVQNIFKCFDEMGISKEEQEKIAYKNTHRVIKETMK